MSRLRRRGDVTPADAGWSYCGLQVLTMRPGEAVRIPADDAERFVVPLSGAWTVEAGPALFVLGGRESVFAGVSDFAYVGRDTAATVGTETGGQVALPSAVCETALPSRYGPAADIAVETRGAGGAERTVRNFGTPDGWPHAERLLACEVITPPGHWSSYPPHKHDGTPPSTVADEEIYYFRVDGADGFALHRTYTGAEHDAAGLEPLDETFVVGDGDIALVPYGYHGPTVAAPGYPLYYLNVLAGPGPERSMAFCDDPAYGWIRGTWTS